jgi:YMGG-like Gly-zipper
MTNPWMAAMIAALGLFGFAAGAEAEIFVYPKPGQSQEAFEKDQFECHNWAKQETGFDPAKPQTVAAAPPRRGGAVRGAAGGAAVGAIGGAIGGDAGKGAAIGAGVGAAAGAMRQGSQNRQAAEAARQAESEQQASSDRYERAYAACLGGRGYTVK